MEKRGKNTWSITTWMSWFALWTLIKRLLKLFVKASFGFLLKKMAPVPRTDTERALMYL